MPPINERITSTLLLHEKMLWTVLTSTDPGPMFEEMCIPSAQLILPKRPITTVGNMGNLLKPPFHRFDSFQLDEARVIIIDLMAGTVTYSLRAIRGGKEYRAIGSTTWNQHSDGEWRIVLHQETAV